MPAKISDLLRVKIGEQGISHRQLAKKINTSKSQLLRILNPKYENNLKLESIRRVASALGYNVELRLITELDEVDPPVRLSDLKRLIDKMEDKYG